MAHGTRARPASRDPAAPPADPVLVS